MLQSLLWSLTAFSSAPLVPSSSMFLFHNITCAGCEKKLGGSDGCLNLVTEPLPAQVNAGFVSRTLFLFRSGICVWDSGPLLRHAPIFLAEILSLSPCHHSGVAGDGQYCKFALWVIILIVLCSALEASSSPVEKSSQYSNSSTLEKNFRYLWKKYNK